MQSKVNAIIILLRELTTFPETEDVTRCIIENILLYFIFIPIQSLCQYYRFKTINPPTNTNNVVVFKFSSFKFYIHTYVDIIFIKSQ